MTRATHILFSIPERRLLILHTTVDVPSDNFFLVTLRLRVRRNEPQATKFGLVELCFFQEFLWLHFLSPLQCLDQLSLSFGNILCVGTQKFFQNDASGNIRRIAELDAPHLCISHGGDDGGQLSKKFR